MEKPNSKDFRLVDNRRMGNMQKPAAQNAVKYEIMSHIEEKH